MITLKDVREYLKTQVSAPAFYIGKLDSKKEQSIGVFSRPTSGQVLPIGGAALSSYNKKRISILVHWGKNADAAERKAMEVYEALFGKSPSIGGVRVIMFRMDHAEPVHIGTDDEGYYEFVIDTTIYYEREAN